MHKSEMNPLNVDKVAAQPSTGGLKVINPALLVGLGILAAGAATPVMAGPAVNDSYTTSVNTPLTGVNVTVNDSVLDSNSYTVTMVTPPLPASGTAVLGGGGQLTFTPAPGFIGTASLTYALAEENPDGNSVATVTISVAPPVQAVPTMTPLAVGGLGALVALMGARRRSTKKED